MKKLFVIIVLVAASNAISARPYNAGLGLRAEAGRDSSFGAAYKQFIRDRFAVEGFLLSDFDKGIELTGLCIIQSDFPGSPEHLQWYAGGGAHAGYWSKKNPRVFGIDGIIGAEYYFKKQPLALSLDWHPVINLATKADEHFYPVKFGITARYCF